MKYIIKNLISHAKKAGWLKSHFVGAIAIFLTFSIASAAIAPEAATIPSIESAIESSSFVGISTGALPKRVMKVVITGYSSTPDQTDDTPFITATGDHVADGIIAANFLPFDTLVQIPKYFGNKIFVVKDRMHRRFSDRVDIWFPDRETALKFGKRTTEIVVL
jgi:3D (Asp-Asp-Asp) domain-containing protein